MSPPTRSVLVIFNPVAGWRRRRRFARFLKALDRTGCRFEVRETAGPGDAGRIARAAAGRYDVIAIAGGDGTVNEAINGLAAADVPIAVVPLGTANVLALELGLPFGMTAAAHTIAEGMPLRIRLGAVNGRRFVQMAGVGFDAHVVAAVTPALKRRLGKAAYVLKTLAGMARYSRADYELDIDGRRVHAASAVIANGHFYGGRFSCAPAAQLADPWLYACLFRSHGGWNALRYAAGLVRGRLAHYPDVEIVRASEIRIAGRCTEPVQADGDIVGTLPAIATVVAETLSILVPPAAGAGLQKRASA